MKNIITNKSLFELLEHKTNKAEIVFIKLLPKNRPIKSWNSVKGETLKPEVKPGENPNDPV